MIAAQQHNQKRQLGIPMTTIKPKQQEEGKEGEERKRGLQMDLRGKGISSRHSYALDIYVIIKCRECLHAIYSYATR